MQHIFIFSRISLIVVSFVIYFQGALYCLLGNHSGVCLANLHDWECIALTWPAVVRSGLSSAMSLEKPSIVRLFDDLADKIHRQYETIGIDFTVSLTLGEKANIFNTPPKSFILKLFGLSVQLISIFLCLLTLFYVLYSFSSLRSVVLWQNSLWLQKILFLRSLCSLKKSMMQV